MSKKVVVMGGGTGIFPVTQALKHLDVTICTIIGVSDSGGSSGKIRDEFGFQPVGDLRQSLAALAESEGQEWIRKLLLYRFSKGSGLKGHNLGNLILTALQDMTGDTATALEKATQVFRLGGTVIPATKELVDLKITYEDGTQLVGEDYLNAESARDQRVTQVELEPAAKLHPQAEAALLEADVVIIGPGDVYGSLLAVLLPINIKEVFARSKARIIYLSNLMTRHLQTDNMTTSEHVALIEEYLGKKVTTILINDRPIPQPALDLYAASHEFPLVDDLDGDSRVYRSDIISEETESTPEGDALHRAYLRHDPQKLLSIFKKIL